MAFKMKGSPMARNFGVGTPAKKTGDPEKPFTPPTDEELAEATAKGLSYMASLSEQTGEQVWHKSIGERKTITY